VSAVLIFNDLLITLLRRRKPKDEEEKMILRFSTEQEKLK